MLILSQQLWIQDPPEEGIHTLTHPHSSQHLNNATSLRYCIVGRPPLHIKRGRLHSMCGGLLVIKLVVMLLPNVYAGLCD